MKSKKTKKEKLASFKKANKTRRDRMAELEGFSDTATYKAWLEGKRGVKHPKKASKANKNVVIHNVHILDASGSMGGRKLENAIEGINSELEELKKDTTGVTYTQTTVVFGSSVRRKCFKVPINEAEEVYTGTIGMTALYQAVGETLEALKDDYKNGEQVLVKIFTDGGENGSRGEYRHKTTLAEFIQECEELGFTITFVGTHQDTFNVIKNLKIRSSNTLTHDNTAKGVAQAFETSSMATKVYATRSMAGEAVLDGFYKQKGELLND